MSSKDVAAQHAGADITVEYVRPTGDYRHRIHDRASEGRTMLDEVRDLWPDPRTRPVLAGIVGYRQVLGAAGEDPGFRLEDPALGRLDAAITIIRGSR